MINFPFPCLAIVMLLVAIITINRKSSEAKMNEAKESFLERENKANATRRQDISVLPYIRFTDELLNPESEKLHELCADELAKINELSEKKILNLTVYSNTDLKLMYGPQNLEALSSYDDNFTDLEIAITNLAKKCNENGCPELSVPYLEFAVLHKTTDSQIYTLLANQYAAKAQSDKIQNLIDGLANQDFMMKKTIVEKLTAML